MTLLEKVIRNDQRSIFIVESDPVFRQNPICKRSISDEMIAPLAPALPPQGAGALAIVPEQVIQHNRNSKGGSGGSTLDCRACVLRRRFRGNLRGQAL